MVYLNLHIIKLKMELVQLMIFVGFIGSSSMLFYVIINICLKLVGIHAYEYSTNCDASKVVIIAKYIKQTHIFTTSIHGDNNPVGFVIGKWYIAYITTTNIQKRDSVSIGYTVTFWSSRIGHTNSLSDEFVDLEKGTNIDDDTRVTETLEVWRHVGAFKSDTVEKFEIPFDNTDCEEQEEVIMRMQQMAQTSYENGFGYRLIAMIAGPSGKGKTQIAKRFAKTINATICDAFNPTRAGENFTSLIKTVKPTKKKPLVVLLDEGDKIIERIHAEIKEHEFFVTAAIDKSSFNKFMDQLSDYNNVFVIFTMNSTFNAIDQLDPSYIRCGRIDLKINYGGDDSYNTDGGHFLQVKVLNNIAENINTIRFTPKPVVILPEDANGEIKKVV